MHHLPHRPPPPPPPCQWPFPRSGVCSTYPVATLSSTSARVTSMSLALLLPACLSTCCSPCLYGFLWQVSKLEQGWPRCRASKRRWSTCSVGQPLTRVRQWNLQTPMAFPSQRGMALRLTPGGTEPHDSWQTCLGVLWDQLLAAHPHWSYLRDPK